MPDRLYESAAAVDPILLSACYQISLIEYHLDCSRTEENCNWPVPPPNPREQPHLYHNDMKVLTSVLRCRLAIIERMEDHHATFAENRLVLNHPVWKTLAKHGIRPPELKRQPLQ